MFYHILHPVQGGQGLPKDQEHQTPQWDQEVRVVQGTLGVQDHLTQKQSVNF